MSVIYRCSQVKLKLAEPSAEGKADLTCQHTQARPWIYSATFTLPGARVTSDEISFIYASNWKIYCK